MWECVPLLYVWMCRKKGNSLQPQQLAYLCPIIHSSLAFAADTTAGPVVAGRSIHTPIHPSIPSFSDLLTFIPPRQLLLVYSSWFWPMKRSTERR